MADAIKKCPVCDRRVATYAELVAHNKGEAPIDYESVCLRGVSILVAHHVDCEARAVDWPARVAELEAALADTETERDMAVSAYEDLLAEAVPCWSCGADPRVCPESGAELPLVAGALDAQEEAERKYWAARDRAAAAGDEADWLAAMAEAMQVDLSASIDHYERMLDSEPVLERVHYDGTGPMEVAMSHVGVRVLVGSLRDSLGDAPNYMEIVVHDTKTDPPQDYVVTIRRRNGKTPAELRRIAEEERDHWRTVANQALTDERGELDEERARADQAEAERDAAMLAHARATMRPNTPDTFNARVRHLYPEHADRLLAEEAAGA